MAVPPAEARERVRRFALRLTGDPVRAEDLAQETMARALAARDDPPHAPLDLPWLFRITLNLVRSEARRAAVRRATTHDPEHLVDRRAPEPDRVAETRERDRNLWRAVGRLPAREREALLLRHAEGLSCTAIAGTLDATPNAISCLLHRARERLRMLMTESTPASPPRHEGGAA